MAQDFSKKFYSSRAWQLCRINYLKTKNYLCERCLVNGEYKPAIEVHHKIYLTPTNINDPTLTLNFDNLEALCHECHTKEHQKRDEKRYTINEDGSIII